MAPLPKYVYCLPGLFGLLAFLLGFGGTSCHFLKFTTVDPLHRPDTAADVDEPGEPFTLQFGYWYYQSWQIINATKYAPNEFNATDNNDDENNTAVESILRESCDYYPSDIHVDNYWKAARIFSVTTFVIGGSILLLNVMMECLSSRGKFYRPTGIGYLVSCLTQGLCLLLLNSDLCKNNQQIHSLEEDIGPALRFGDTCALSTGANCTIAATVFWFLAGVAFAKVHPREEGGDGSGGERRHGIDLDQPLYEELIPEHSEDDLIHGSRRR